MNNRVSIFVFIRAASKKYTLPKVENVFKQSIAFYSTSHSEKKSPNYEKENTILSETIKSNGLLTLNRPKYRNALNIKMYETLYSILNEWETSKNLVIVEGAGNKAFCSGGDLGLSKHYSDPDAEEIKHYFFTNAYRLYYKVYSYKIPYIALMDNITMGAGAGISIVSKYKIVTERSIFAMPEASIGFHVDAGCTYVFPRLQGCLGLFLALTGYRLKGLDILKSGLANYYVPAERIQDLKNELLHSDNQPVDIIIEKYQDIPNEEFGLAPYMHKIDACFSASTVEEIISRLEDGSSWGKKVIKMLAGSSPTSLKVIKAAIERGVNLSFEDCLRMEYRLSCSLTDNADVYEGIRAMIVDKDGKPNWNPNNLKDVTVEDIDQHFEIQSPEKELKLL